MTENNDVNFIDNIKVIINAYLQLIKELFTLINLEALLAKESLFKILGLAAFAVVILLSTWLSLLGVLIAWLIQLHFNWLFALAIVVALNIFILLMIFFSIIHLKNNLTFSATRRQIAHLKSVKEDQN